MGRQVTYAGHPLYLFDQAPGQVSGEDWDEPGLPPWRGVWTVLSPSGRREPWPGMLTVTTIGRRQVLAAMMQTLIGTVAFPVCASSKDGRRVECLHRLLRQGLAAGDHLRPARLVGRAEGRHLGAFVRPGGTVQVTYDGHPLYLYSNEGLTRTSTGYRATGNGDGVKVNGGMFTLITL